MIVESNKVTLQKVFDEFIDDAAVRNLSHRTIYYYSYCFKWLSKSLPPETNIFTVTKENIKSHIRFLMKTNKATSVNTHLTGIRAIFNYANEYYGTCIKVKLIKTDFQAKPTYSDEELRRLLKKPSADCDFTEYRNWVMTNVFVGTGCRLGSCLSLKVKDIEFNSNTIYFAKMKCRKALLLPLNNYLKNVLAEYIKNTGLQPFEYMFPSQRTGTKFTDKGFDSSYIDYAARRGVKNVGIHKFRHTYAKNFIMAGGNPAKLQRILGHSSIDITMKYVNLYSVDLKDDINDYCVLSRLNNN